VRAGQPTERGLDLLSVVHERRDRGRGGRSGPGGLRGSLDLRGGSGSEVECVILSDASDLMTSGERIQSQGQRALPRNDRA
jgi:hypothetical protein